MSNKAIIDKTIEALEARGFSKAESSQIVKRIQSGKDDFPEAKTEDPLKVYARGFEDGRNYEKQHRLMRESQLYRQQMGMAAAAQSQAGHFGALNNIYANIFGGK